ncbi:MAG: hypothetical protein ACREBI_05150 [Nitrosotalea sp.]
MHKLKIALGIGLLVIGGIFFIQSALYYFLLTNPLPSSPNNGAPCAGCLPISMTIGPKAQFTLIIGLTLAPTGIWLLILGLKNASLASLSGESRK